jgi:hypothetical protein
MNNAQLQTAIESIIVAIKEFFNAKDSPYSARTAATNHLEMLYKIQAARANMINKGTNVKS